jgi:CheY-like chemotaxis protein
MNETYGHAERLVEEGKGLSRNRFPVTEILLFDDNANFAETWASLLREQNFLVETEHDPRQVGKKVREKSFDVILLDILVEEGDYDGIDALIDIMVYSKNKNNQVIVVSGPGTREDIVSCMKHGACDFINKDSLREPGDVEFLVDRIVVALQTPEIKVDPDILRQNLISFLWSKIRQGDRASMGRRLEQMFKLMFESLPAFDEVETNYRTNSQEIDLVITHHNSHPIWQEFGGVFWGECKNWSQEGHRPQTKDLASFTHKLKRRGRLGKLGFFISYNGFSQGFMEEVRTYNSGSRIVVPLDKGEISEMVTKRDGAAREIFLRDLVIKATLR